MQAPPPPYSVRRARLDEAGAIAAMIAVSDRSVGSEPTYFETDLLDDWTRDEFDLERDTWVIESPSNEIVGYSELFVEGATTLTSFGAVHPNHRGRGLGSYLVDRLEEAAEIHPVGHGAAVTLFNVILPSDAAAVALLSARGYRKERTFQHMEIALADFDAFSASDPVDIRPFDPRRDREAMHRLMESAFQRHWDYSPTPFEKWWNDAAGSSGYDPSLWWWAYIEGRPAGALLARVRDAQGWVGDLGVLEQWRGRGAGAALLRHAFGEFKRRGFDKVGLNVDSENETGASRLYASVGMRVTQQFDFYKKVLVR